MTSAGRRVLAPLSVLDRLLPDDPSRHARVDDGSADPGRLRAALLRDLEALLNTRRPWRSHPDWLPFLRTSVMSYGLEDFAGGRIEDDRERQRLCDGIATAIARFEPRLTQVEVELMEMPSELEAVLAFRISAVLLVDPVPEPIVFDTMVDVTTSDIHLRAQKDA
ncbi:MAG: type VI secretion system baseplate subunit TssE [Gluconacetobacter diazotrophicus]|nr:type VI secretion system baseplate subunit TssE [Gluconacetobacter diazotrophicus]